MIVLTKRELLALPIANMKQLSSTRLLLLVSTLAILFAGLVATKILWEHTLIAHSDFNQDYQAGIALRNNTPIYGGWNDHPPFVALAVAPLTLLSERHAFIAFGCGSFMLYLSTCFLLSRELQLGRTWRVLAAGALLWMPLLFSLSLGALSPLLASLIALGWITFRRQNDLATGILWALAISLKLFPALIIIYICAARRWKALIALLASVAVLSVTTISFVGVESFTQYFTQVAAANTLKFAPFIANLSITGLVVRFFGYPNEWTSPLSNVGHTGLTFGLLVSIAASVWLYLFCRRAMMRAEAHDYCFGITCVGMLLISPITWAHACVILLPAFALLIRDYGVADAGVARWKLLSIYLCLSQVDSSLIMQKARTLSPAPLPWYYANLALLSQGGIIWLGYVLVHQTRRKVGELQNV